VTASSDAQFMSDRAEGEQAMLRQILIILASVAAALSAASLGGGGGP
jgi:hypothetical protein